MILYSLIIKHVRHRSQMLTKVWSENPKVRTRCEQNDNFQNTVTGTCSNDVDWFYLVYWGFCDNGNK